MIRNWKGFTRTALLFPAALLCPMVGCTTLGIVGGDCGEDRSSYNGQCLDECPDGLVDCDGMCVDLSDDEEHCGTCDTVCEPEESCSEGLCVGGSVDCSPPFEEAFCGECCGEETPVCSPFSGGFACTEECESPLEDCSGICVDPDDDERNCGKCGNVCATGQTCEDGTCTGGEADCTAPFSVESCPACCDSDEICSPLNSGYECVDECESGLEECDGACVDVDVDPDHCGECGETCAPFGYCQDGECVEGVFGHLVVLCMDFEEAIESSPAQWLLGNSVFLPAVPRVDILAYAAFTPGTQRDNVERTLGWASSTTGQAIALDYESESDAIPDRLAAGDSDTFLIYAQSEAPDGEMAEIGEAWKSALLDYVDAGGTIVVLSGGQGEMGEFLTSAGLLEITDETPVSGDTLENRTPTDSVGNHVLSPFTALSNTCVFSTPEAPSPTVSYVVGPPGPGDQPPEAGDTPTVVHKLLIGP